ncbi:MAG: DUF5700 domain-containing putative Zn-dependent protease [Ferruginibacter sp.]
MQNLLIKVLKYTLLLLPFWPLPSRSQTINTAPLDAYWKMVEPLKHGDSLSQEQWRHFLSLEANNIYIKNQGFSDAYLESLRKNIQYVYMPQYDSLLKSRLKFIEADPASFWLTYKVYVYKKFETELKDFEEKIKEAHYLDDVYANAWQWLPKKLQKKDTSVTINLLGIENDAIAGDGIIIVTLWSLYNQDKLKPGILAGHEMHHVLRGGRGFRNVAEEDKGIIYFLNSVLNEGTADMVDKKYMLTRENELPMEFQFSDFILNQADSIIRQVDTSLINMAHSNGRMYKTEKDYRNLIRWTSGHCPGYYMADIIVINGYKKQLLKNIRNPFYFIYLYNRAALRDVKQPPVFAKASIQYIRSLEKKYLTGKNF